MIDAKKTVVFLRSVARLYDLEAEDTVRMLDIADAIEKGDGLENKILDLACRDSVVNDEHWDAVRTLCESALTLAATPRPMTPAEFSEHFPTGTKVKYFGKEYKTSTGPRVFLYPGYACVQLKDLTLPDAQPVQELRELIKSHPDPVGRLDGPPAHGEIRQDGTVEPVREEKPPEPAPTWELVREAFDLGGSIRGSGIEMPQDYEELREFLWEKFLAAHKAPYRPTPDEQAFAVESVGPPKGETTGHIEGIGKYRKRPVVIEAVHFVEDIAWEYFLEGKLVFGKFTVNGNYHKADHKISRAWISITTLEGNMRADLGDWIIRGVKGEFYPCKPDIFDSTYIAIPSRPDYINPPKVETEAIPPQQKEIADGEK